MSEPSAQSSFRGALLLYSDLWRYAKGRRPSLVGALSLLTLSQVFKLGIPYLAARAINTLQLRGLEGLSIAGLWLLLVFLATVASWCLHGPGRVLERNVAWTVRSGVAASLIERLMSLPLAWHELHHSGATAHRVQQSSRAIGDFAQSQFIYLQNAMRLVGPVVALWLIEPVVGAVALVGFAVISLAVSGFDRIMIRLAHQENDAERRYAASVIDSLANVTSVFALRQMGGIMALLRRRMATIFEPLRRSILVNESKWCVVDLSAQALSCVLVALFAYLAGRGLHAGSPATGLGPGDEMRTLRIGDVYMVWEYAQQAGGVIAAFAQHFQTFARQRADYASADEIRQASAGGFADPAPVTMRLSWRRLNVRGLSYRYTVGRGEAPALDDLSFTLERGKRYALIGGSGSGKSTLLRVLAGLYLAERIAISCDDRPPLTDPVAAQQLLRATATLVPQDAEVLEGTLAENLALCASVDGPPPPARYGRALELACATDFVDVSEQGLAAPVAERGANWSGGQRARVALARGILAAEGSGLVLLDEPTANLDPRRESEVYDNLFANFADACIVSSVHRLNLLDRFDEVLLMQQGRLLDHGPVAELAVRSTEFRQMQSAQRRAG
jgi:ABC-type multidrug transport system fused ATPase/permease subunit